MSLNEKAQAFIAAHNALNETRFVKVEATDYAELSREAKITAHAFLANAGDRHRIEEQAVVYLRLDGARWVVDGPTPDDSWPLDGYTDGPVTSECECGDEEECHAAQTAATYVDGLRITDLYARLTEFLAGVQ